MNHGLHGLHRFIGVAGGRSRLDWRLMTVDFRTHIPNLFEIIRTGLSLAVWEDNETSQFVETVTVLIGKMCLFSYELITQLSILELAACAICIALKLVHNLKPKLEIESFVC